MSTTEMVPATRDTHALEPATMNDAMSLAGWMHESGMFPETVRSPSQALMILMKGRELGITALQAATDINVIKGKISLSANLVRAVVLGRGAAHYFRPVLEECDNSKAVFETHRRGEDKPHRMVFTLEQARGLGLLDRDQWKKQPATMLRHRAAVALAREIYPDVLAGVYLPDEIEDIPTPARPGPTPVTAHVSALDEAYPKARARIAGLTTESIAEAVKWVGTLPDRVQAEALDLIKARQIELAQPESVLGPPCKPSTSVETPKDESRGTSLGLKIKRGGEA